MAIVPNQNNNYKVESRFNQTDYVLLISSIGGFIFLSIGLLVIFVGRKFRSQTSNNAADMELQTPNDLNNETERLILKPSFNKNKNGPKSQPFRREINILQCDDDCKGVRPNEFDHNDSREHEDKDLFKYMYPQLALYNLFNIKSPLTITEIRNDDDDPSCRKEPGKLRDNQRRDNAGKIKITVDDETVDFTDFFEQEPNDDVWKDIKNSLNDPVYEMSICSSSSDSSLSNSFNISTGKRQFVEDNIVDRLSERQSLTESIVQAEEGVLKTSQPLVQSDTMDTSIGSLQKDVLICIEKTNASVKNSESKVKLNEEDDTNCVNCDSTSSMENHIANAVQNKFLQRTDDHYLLDSPDTSTSTYWPGRNLNPSNTQLPPRFGVSIESVNDPTSSITFSTNEGSSLENVNEQQPIFSFKSSRIQLRQKLFKDVCETDNFDFSLASQSFASGFRFGEDGNCFGENDQRRLLENGIQTQHERPRQIIADDVKRGRMDLDNALSVNQNLQINKMADSDTEGSSSSVKLQFRKNNVQETMKLFENAVSEATISPSPHYI